MSTVYVSPWLRKSGHLDRLKTLDPKGGQFSMECHKGTDHALDRWYNLEEFDDVARIDKLVREIMRETDELRWLDKLAPFVPGPIGAYVKAKRPRKLTPAQIKAAHNRRMQDKQEEMLARRRKNDLALRGKR